MRSGWPSRAKRQSCGISICRGDRANELLKFEGNNTSVYKDQGGGFTFLVFKNKSLPRLGAMSEFD